MRSYFDFIQRATVVLLVFALLSVFLISSVVSCNDRLSAGRAGNRGAQTGKVDAEKGVVDEASKPQVRKSAGACIYGEPEKIEIYAGGDVRALRPGEKYFDDLCRPGERIILRAAELSGESKAPGVKVKEMGENPKYEVKFTYAKPPTFTFIGDSTAMKQKAAARETDPSTVTFFIPERVEDMEPGTAYDGFYYGDIKVISTLTNSEIAETLDAIYGAE